MDHSASAVATSSHTESPGSNNSIQANRPESHDDTITDAHEDIQNKVQRCLALLRQHGIRLVVFDMDQTAVVAHSHGKLKRNELDAFLNKASADWVHLVPALHEAVLMVPAVPAARTAAAGFSVAVATHSDAAEYGRKDPSIQPATHILGDELARALVDRHFSPATAAAIFCVAYNPRHRGAHGQMEEHRIKRYHVLVLQQHFGVDAAEIIFFDDTPQVVQDCRETCGVHAVQVDPNQGFVFADLLSYNFASL
jgi:hypothetical protein